MQMAFFGFGKSKAVADDSAHTGQADQGILVFENTGEVILAENILKRHEWDVRVLGPPPEIRQGCDLVIEFPLIEELQRPCSAS